MSTSNWKQGKEQSDFHFDWKRHETGGHDYKWLARFEGDWSKELEVIKETAQPKTWASRGKNYHKDHPALSKTQREKITTLVGTTLSMKDKNVIEKYHDNVMNLVAEHEARAKSETITKEK